MDRIPMTQDLSEARVVRRNTNAAIGMEVTASKRAWTREGCQCINRKLVLSVCVEHNGMRSLR